jgi:hypothetical protein
MEILGKRVIVEPTAIGFDERTPRRYECLRPSFTPDWQA